MTHESSLFISGRLVSAAAKGNASAVRQALHNHKGDPDAKVKDAGEERGPLHVASGYGQHEVVAELLKVKISHTDLQKLSMTINLVCYMFVLLG